MDGTELIIADRRILVRQAKIDEIIDLRHRVLRQGLPREAAIFSGDDAPASLHFGAFLNGQAVGCATFHFNQWQGRPAWQLRGMATDQEFRGKGVGRRVLELSEQTIQANSPVKLLWCNARTPARRFYEKLGWQAVGEEFFIETAGPHFRMFKEQA